MIFEKKKVFFDILNFFNVIDFSIIDFINFFKIFFLILLIFPKNFEKPEFLKKQNFIVFFLSSISNHCGKNRTFFCKEKQKKFDSANALYRTKPSISVFDSNFAGKFRLMSILMKKNEENSKKIEVDAASALQCKNHQNLNFIYFSRWFFNFLLNFRTNSNH